RSRDYLLNWLGPMKTRLSIMIALFVLPVLSLCVHAQTQTDARQVWNTAMDRLAQRERTHCSAFVFASLERSIQRTGEEAPTIITKATARIWQDDPKYRVEIENEISMEAPKQGIGYSPT